MNYKVVRDASGEAICFGPNTDQYEPDIPTGATLTIEVTTPAKSRAEFDREINAAAKANLDQLRADIFPDVLSFLATLPGAPLSIKDAAVIAVIERAKIKT